ncbi:MAG TPA: HDIG domain-containing protein [Rhodothermales bacterium]|nr:HDIG domain-containing protein [Rhodothermales bacterium]
MPPSRPGYDDALALLHEWTQSDSLRRHAYAVEAAVEAYAEHFDVEDVELWRMTALLHDMDYERHPTPAEHPFVGVEELRRRGYPEEMTTAILGHAQYSGVPRETLLAKTLFACDELAGFVTACAYVRPNGISDLETRSVLKKLKDKAFAAAVSREDIRQGAEELGVDLSDHVARVIEGIRRRADRIFGPAV